MDQLRNRAGCSRVHMTKKKQIKMMTYLIFGTDSLRYTYSGSVVVNDSSSAFKYLWYETV